MQKKEQIMTFDPVYPTEAEVLQTLQKSSLLYCRYQTLNSDWKQKFMDFCTGKKTLPLTYDPFFKRLFHPDIHPDRLSRLLSSLLNRTVKVIKILPTENTLLDGDALLIMDILVELEDGALANVEVQKIPYNFPGERMSCYSADLIMRQYNRVKGNKGKNFKYDDIKKVYTIILYEKTTAAFHTTGNEYIHLGKIVFDTGLPIELLEEYCLVALDVFRKIPYPKDRSERTAWIGLLSTENMEDAELLIAEYPWLAEIYAEIAGYMHKPEEVLTMFSDALKILDHNTVQYMIEEQAQLLEEQLQKISEQTQQLDDQKQQINAQNQQLSDQKQQLHDQKQQLHDQKQQLHDQKQQLHDQKQQLHDQKQQLHDQKQQLHDQKQQLTIKDHQLSEEKYKTYISACQDMNLTKEETIQKIISKFVLSKETAEEKMNKYW